MDPDPFLVWQGEAQARPETEWKAKGSSARARHVVDTEAKES